MTTGWCLGINRADCNGERDVITSERGVYSASVRRSMEGSWEEKQLPFMHTVAHQTSNGIHDMCGVVHVVHNLYCRNGNYL